MKRAAVCLGLIVVVMFLIYDETPSNLISVSHVSAATAEPPLLNEYKQILNYVQKPTGDRPISPEWVDWHPNGEYLGIAFENENSITILDTNTIQPIFTIETDELLYRDVFDFAWSPDGKYLAGTFITDIKIWTLSDSGTELYKTIPRSDCCSLIYWSQDSRKVITLGFMGNTELWTFAIWDVTTGQQSLYKDDKHILSVSPDNKKLLNFDNKLQTNNLQILDAITFNVLLEYSSNYPEYDSILYQSWSADSRKVAGVSLRQSGQTIIWMWDTETDKILEYPTDVGGLTEILRDSIALSPSGNILAITDHKWVNFWNIDTGELLNPLQGATDDITAISWHPTKDWLALSSLDGSVQIWEIKAK